MNTTKVVAIVSTILLVVIALLYGASLGQVGGLTQQKNSLQTQIDYLQNQTSTLQDIATNLTNQLNEANKQVASLKEPRLTTLAMSLSANKTEFQTNFVRITGYVINTGRSTAHNCTLHVLLYENQTVIKEANISLPNMEADKYTVVDQTINLENAAATDWKMDVRWTT